MIDRSQVSPQEDAAELNSEKIVNTLTSLASERPLFHSEADFQHALAWQVRVASPDARIRLETRPVPGMRLDALVLIGDRRIGIELKYFARRLRTTVGSESFELPDQGAQDVRRYDFVKDLTRLERLIDKRAVDEGFAIALTNDAGYWNQQRNPGVADEAFRISEGRTLTGRLAWAGHASAGTMRGRESPLVLAGSYTMRWREFSLVNAPNGKFRYLLIRIGGSK